MVLTLLVDLKAQFAEPVETNSLSTEKCVPTAVPPVLDALGMLIPSVRRVQMVTLTRLVQAMIKRACSHHSVQSVRLTVINKTSSARAMERSVILACIAAMTSKITQPNLASSQPMEVPHTHSESLLARPVQKIVLVKRILSANQVPARYYQEMTALLIKLNANRYLRVKALIRIRNA